jgi:hypothetical protein
MNLKTCCIAAMLSGLAIFQLQAQSGLPALPPAANAPSYDDWENELNHILEDEADQGGLVPGEEIQAEFQICVNNFVVNVPFVVFVTKGGGIFFQQQGVTTTSKECKTSIDFMALDLANQGTLTVVLNTLRGQPAGTPGPGGPVGPFTRGVTRDASAPVLPNLLPALADVPFLPFYPQSKVPPLPACTAATAPDAMIVDHLSGTVTRYNTCTGNNVAVIAVTSNPLQVALVADGSLALVTSFDGAVGFIDTASNTVTSLFTAGLNPSGLAISPDNTYAFITSFNDATPVLAKVDLTQRQIVKTLQMPFQYPQSVTFNPEGSQAYVMFPFTSTLVIVDTLTMTVASTIQLPGPAFGTVFNSTGTQAFVGVRSSPGQVLVINAATYQIQKSIAVDDNPTDLKVMGNDQLLVVGNYYGQSLSFIYMPALALLNSVSVGGPPRGLVQVQ